jgi:hypothetical protein
MKHILLTLLVALLPTVTSAQVLGQGRWCFVPQGSEVLFCDYQSYASCLDANSSSANAGGVCVMRPSR